MSTISVDLKQYLTLNTEQKPLKTKIQKYKIISKGFYNHINSETPKKANKHNVKEKSYKS